MKTVDSVGKRFSENSKVLSGENNQEVKRTKAGG